MFNRTRGAALAHVESVRRALQRVMPGSGYVTVRPFSDIIDAQTRSWRLGATMFTVFGVLALLVAAVGLYSVVGYGVMQRRHEIGVRLALGASGGNIIGMVVADVRRTVGVVAIVVGIGVTLVASPRIEPLLFDVSGRDPVTLIGCALALLAVALTASIVPAIRAAKTDPNIALRSGVGAQQVARPRGPPTLPAEQLEETRPEDLRCHPTICCRSTFSFGECRPSVGEGQCR